MERRSLLFYFVASLVAIAVILLTTFVFFKISRDCEDSGTCLGPECVQAAAEILNYLDTTIDPCDNFYAFACGNFISNVEIADNEDYASTSSKMYEELHRQLRESLEEPAQVDDPKYIKTLKEYYQACNDIVAVEQSGLVTVISILEEIGGWPVLEGHSWRQNQFNWYEAIYKLKKIGVDTNFFVTLTVANDIENSDRPILKLDLPKLSIFPSISTQRFNEISRMYYQYMIGVAKKMGANESRAVDELHHSLEFEISLAHIAVAEEDPLILTLSELDNRFPSIPWFEYINNLVSPHAVITKGETILVGVPSYIKSLNLLLSKTPRRIQANYIMWRVVNELIPYLGEEFRERAFAYESAVFGVSEKPPRWQYCVGDAYDRLPLLLSSLYVQKYFDEEAKRRTTILVGTIKEQFLSILERLDWADVRKKENALIKAAKITDFIAYPDEFLNGDKLKRIFNKLEVNSESYLQSYLNISLLNKELSIRSLRLSHIEDYWFDNRIIAEMQTSYDPLENRISVSAGILQGLLFNKNHPSYLNYGGIGFMLARELTQAFDWWEAETENLGRISCYIRQYSNFIVREIDEPVNGTNTVTENVADNTGLKLAYQSYTKWVECNGPQESLAALPYTTNQLFWISFAVNQCSKEKPEFMKTLMQYGNTPAEFRVLGALANLEPFARDFNCPEGSPMNPLNKCVMWPM